MPVSDSKKYYCSFCGKAQDEVAVLIAGPGNLAPRGSSAAARRFDQDQLAAVQKSRERAGRLDLRVGVSSGVVERFDVDAGNLHIALIP